jgi:hypothetical protein
VAPLSPRERTRINTGARLWVAVAIAVLAAHRKEDGVVAFLHVDARDQRAVVGAQFERGGAHGADLVCEHEVELEGER